MPNPLWRFAQAAITIEKALPVMPVGQVGIGSVAAGDMKVVMLAVKFAEVLKPAVPRGFERHPLDAQSGQALAFLRRELVTAGGLALSREPDAQRRFGWDVDMLMLFTEGGKVGEALRP